LVGKIFGHLVLLFVLRFLGRAHTLPALIGRRDWRRFL
jgi:hypothetical protein